MTDTVAAALITVVGTVTVAVVSVITQLKVTKAVIRSEHQKLSEQISGETRARTLERRQDLIRENISELLPMIDPEINARIGYDNVVRIIHSVQLLLDPHTPSELRLNGDLNELGVALQSYVQIQHIAFDNRLQHVQQILNIQSNISDHTRVVLGVSPPELRR
jgi:hypothetical protein